MRAFAAIALAAIWCAARPELAAASPDDDLPAAASGTAAAGSDATAPRDAGIAWLDVLGSSDPGEIDRAIAAILALPPRDADPDVLFAAGRACEDKLLDPGRAVAIYDRLAADHPTARATAAAVRRAATLREQIGPRGEFAAPAGELAQLVARADALPGDAVIERGERLAAAAWPGAPTAALWLADWLRRTGRFDAAQARYAQVIARWPALPQAGAALRGAIGCALDARNWALAEVLARKLPAADPLDQALRDDQLAAAARGRRREHWYVAAWLAIAGVLAALLGSLAEAALRSPVGTRRSVLRPPIEAVFFAPVALVLIGIAFTAHRLIAPAVTTIAVGGLALTWLSGATLERLRAHGRARRLRSIAHVLACLTGIAALAYVALTRDHLLDLLIETVRFGPEG